MGTWVQQFICGLHGHDELMHFEKDRLSLVCVSCGRQTPGWHLSLPKPVVTASGDRRRHRLAHASLVSPRRAA